MNNEFKGGPRDVRFCMNVDQKAFQNFCPGLDHDLHGFHGVVRGFQVYKCIFNEPTPR